MPLLLWKTQSRWGARLSIFAGGAAICSELSDEDEAATDSPSESSPEPEAGTHSSSSSEEVEILIAASVPRWARSSLLSSLQPQVPA